MCAGGHDHEHEPDIMCRRVKVAYSSPELSDQLQRRDDLQDDINMAYQELEEEYGVANFIPKGLHIIEREDGEVTIIISYDISTDTLMIKELEKDTKDKNPIE